MYVGTDIKSYLPVYVDFKRMLLSITPV